MPKPASWLVRFIAQWRVFLGLNEWRLSVELTDTPGGIAGCDGVALIDHDLARAALQFTPDLGPLDEAQTVVLHELLHVRLEPITHLVRTYMLPRLSVDDESILGPQFESALERTVEQTARAMLVFLHTLAAENAEGEMEQLLAQSSFPDFLHTA